MTVHAIENVYIQIHTLNGKSGLANAVYLNDVLARTTDVMKKKEIVKLTPVSDKEYSVSDADMFRMMETTLKSIGNNLVWRNNVKAVINFYLKMITHSHIAKVKHLAKPDNLESVCSPVIDAMLNDKSEKLDCVTRHLINFRINRDILDVILFALYHRGMRGDLSETESAEVLAHISRIYLLGLYIVHEDRLLSLIEMYKENLV